MKDIDLSLISKYRGELMGFAMIYVVMFHVCGNRHDTLWYCLAATSVLTSFYSSVASDCGMPGPKIPLCAISIGAATSVFIPLGSLSLHYFIYPSSSTAR